MKRVFQLLFVLCMSSMLLAPMAIKFAHTFYVDHEHHFCMAEANGEIHFHAVEYDCDFQPLFLAPFYFVADQIPFRECHYWTDQLTLSDHAIIALQFQQTPYLRGPPHV
jgi:hypothetical protein